jgi:hypothetical protein
MLVTDQYPNSLDCVEQLRGHGTISHGSRPVKGRRAHEEQPGHKSTSRTPQFKCVCLLSELRYSEDEE